MKRRISLFGLLYLHGFVRIWYGLTCWFSYRRSPAISRFVSPDAIGDLISSYDTYKADPLGGRLDYMTHPRRVEARLRAKEPRKLGDCDDHAIYWCATLYKSGLSTDIRFGVYRAVRDGKTYGHAVVVFKYHGGWFYADYGRPRPIDRPEDFAKVDAALRRAEPIGGFLLPLRKVSNGDTPMFGRGTGFKA